MIGAATRISAVIGDPVAHSLSPAIHNAAFRALGLDWAYVAFRVAPERIGDAVAGVRGFGIRGLSVTIPHKVAIIPHLDAVDEIARWVGSVNTVVNDDGTLTGCTTDGHGALEAFRAAGATTAGRRVLLLGSGGAARAIAFAVARDAAPAAIEILGIDEGERERLAADLAQKTGVSVTAGPTDRLERALARAEFLIQATPIGMHPKEDATLVPARLLRRGLVVFDAVYTPLRTRLLREAEAAGATAIPGVGMFVHQAAVQFKLWTGQDAPIDVMEKVLLDHLRESAR
ncbi:MAG: shikimate dehydrogenase [Planctomycetes bacterium]|nr:shikimate dehydrogenase [Planctomycetota bacterium]